MTIEERLIRAFGALRRQHTASPEAWQAIQQGLARRRQRRLLARIGLAVAPLVAVSGLGVGAEQIFSPAGQPVHLSVGPGPSTPSSTSASSTSVTLPGATTVPTTNRTTPTTAGSPTTGSTVPPVPPTVAPVTAPPTTVPPTTTTLPPTTTTVPPPPTTLPPPPPTSPPTSATAPGVITGTVDDTSGQPVAGAYVIAVDSPTVVARTDASGRYTMLCQAPADGISRGEALVASAWPVPVGEPYTPPPAVTGPGYVFSGDAPNLAQASTINCGGPPANFVLPSGGGADIEFLDPSGAPLVPAPNAVPVDNLYLPGFGGNGTIETAPLSGNHQIVQQLGAGTLYIDGTTSTLSCRGTGVVPDAGRAGADVTITPGTTTQVICTT